MKIGDLKEFDTTEVLTNEETIQHYLAIAFEEGDPRHIQQALWTVARARGVSQVASDAGLAEDDLRASLSDGGDLSFATFVKVLRALGFNLSPFAA
ncbi:addiction module antidote protein [Cupriavidus sp. UME77]|uniref:addiction module antidote protein n=1 Tax=Cupriavidus sp. UME77 TaxID=1862321 RepID=UPI00351C375E